MICFDDDGQEYWQSPEIPRRFFDWVDQPLTDEDAAEGAEYYNQALLTDQACWILQHSPTIQASFEIYDEMQEVTIVAEELERIGGAYNQIDRRVLIRNTQNLWNRVNIVTHEFGHAVQGFEGLLGNKCQPKHRATVLIEEADCNAYEVTVAFELRSIFPQIWYALKKYSKNSKMLCDLFEEKVRENNNFLFDGTASREVFMAFISQGMSRRVYFEYYGIQRRYGNGREKRITTHSAHESLKQYYNALRGMPFTIFNGTEYEVVEREEYLNPDDAEQVVRAIQMRP